MPPDNSEFRCPDVQSEDIASTVTCIAEAIKELECALESGNLDKVLLNHETRMILADGIVAQYEYFCQNKLDHNFEFRRRWIEIALSRFTHDLRQPSHVFGASASGDDWKVTCKNYLIGKKTPDIYASDEVGEIVIRPTQLAPCRRWGNWFCFGRKEVDKKCASSIVASVIERLVSDIVCIRSIESTYCSGISSLESVTWEPDVPGRKFEALIFDILNEVEVVSKFAKLSEDILERTDMRVKYPGILRNAGARIQLSFTTDLDYYAKKIDSIRFNREFIQLSPVELAYEIIENACASYFHGIDWMAVWAELGFPQNDRADVAALARRLGALFSRAINHANDHPMGPVHFVPNCIKEVIRVYVKGHAFITTDELRSREHYRGRFRGSARL